MDKNFRSALNGFNRADVVNYMEECSINQEKVLRQLREENGKLRESLDELQVQKQALADALETAQAQPAPPAEPVPAEPVHLPPCVPGELELSAYRRAEAMERGARQRARRVCRQVNEIIENAAGHMTESGSDVETLMQDLRINLRRLTDTIAELKLTFDDTASALDAIDPLSTADYE